MHNHQTSFWPLSQYHQFLFLHPPFSTQVHRTATQTKISSSSLLLFLSTSCFTITLFVRIEWNRMIIYYTDTYLYIHAPHVRGLTHFSYAGIGHSVGRVPLSVDVFFLSLSASPNKLGDARASTVLLQLKRHLSGMWKNRRTFRLCSVVPNATRFHFSNSRYATIDRGLSKVLARFPRGIPPTW